MPTVVMAEVGNFSYRLISNTVIVSYLRCQTPGYFSALAFGNFTRSLT